MNNSINESFLIASEELTEGKAERTIKKVRRQAKKGKGDYKLNKAQQNFLKTLKKKYGKEAVDELIEFRVSTLAPYHHAQKETRKVGLITTRDLVGMSKKEWERAVESGRNKILKRKDVLNKIESDFRAIEHNKRSIAKLESIKRMISSDTRDFNADLVRSEIDKFIKSYNFISGGEIKDLRQVQKYANDIDKSWDSIKNELDKKSGADLKVVSKEARDILDRQYNYRRSGGEKEDKLYDEELSKSVAAYYLRQNIVNKILSSGQNVFKSFYYTFLDNLSKDARRRINEHMDNLRKRESITEFNPIEKKVWGIRKNASPKSGTLSDYYLKIEEEDFEDRNEPVSIKQPEEMKSAKKRIENERYNFTQRFRKKYDISEKDFDMLQLTGLLSFVDVKQMYEYAKTKLGTKMSNYEIKKALAKIVHKNTDEKSIIRAVNKLAGRTIDKEDMYRKAYSIFSNSRSKSETQAIVDSLIKTSKTEKEVEDKIKGYYEKMADYSDARETFIRSAGGNE